MKRVGAIQKHSTFFYNIFLPFSIIGNVLIIGFRSLSIESQKKFLTFFQFIKMLAYNFLAIFLHDKIEVPNSIFKNWSNSLFNIQFLFSSTRLIIFKCCFKA